MKAKNKNKIGHLGYVALHSTLLAFVPLVFVRRVDEPSPKTLNIATAVANRESGTRDRRLFMPPPIIDDGGAGCNTKGTLMVDESVNALSLLPTTKCCCKVAAVCCCCALLAVVDVLLSAEQAIVDYIQTTNSVSNEK